MLPKIVLIIAAAGVTSQQSPSGDAQSNACQQIPNFSFERAGASLTTLSAAANVKVKLTLATRDQVWSEFCAAAKEKFNKGYSFDLIDAKAGASLTEYLTRQISPDKKGRSLSAILGSALGVPGLSRPKVKRYSVLTVSGVERIDRISINGATEYPYSKYLISIGKASVIGYKDGKEICELQGDAAPNTPLILDCEAVPHAAN